MPRVRKPRALAIDQLIGRRIHDYRVLRGMTQTKLAGTAGVTFQQMQKYERGTNRISAARLYLFAEALNVPIAELFADMPTRVTRKPGNGSDNGAANSAALPSFDGVPFSRETMQLMRYATLVPSPHRKALIAFAKKAGTLSQP